MGRKKSISAKKKKRVKTVKSASRRTKAPAKKKSVKKKATAKKKTAKKSSSKKAAKKAKAKKRGGKSQSLGRPRVSLDGRLDLLFQKDYQSREVFDYLRLTTVRELQEFTPDEIIQKLAGPLYQTVQRIRKTMALCNRSLSGDQKFALEFKERLKSGR